MSPRLMKPRLGLYGSATFDLTGYVQQGAETQLTGETSLTISGYASPTITIDEFAVDGLVTIANYDDLEVMLTGIALPVRSPTDRIGADWFLDNAGTSRTVTQTREDTEFGSLIYAALDHSHGTEAISLRGKEFDILEAQYGSVHGKSVRVLSPDGEEVSVETMHMGDRVRLRSLVSLNNHTAYLG
jgi:hypothetical protein